MNTMHDLLTAYPDVLARRRLLPRTREVRFRFVAPEHGRFGPRLYVPTRRERIVAWLRRVRSVDWSTPFALTLSVLFLLYVLWEAGR